MSAFPCFPDDERADAVRDGPTAIAEQMRGVLDEKPNRPVAPAKFQIRKITCLCKFEGCGALDRKCRQDFAHPLQLHNSCRLLFQANATEHSSLTEA